MPCLFHPGSQEVQTANFLQNAGAEEKRFSFAREMVQKCKRPLSDGIRL
jgi:hypothetical protein